MISQRPPLGTMRGEKRQEWAATKGSSVCTPWSPRRWRSEGRSRKRPCVTGRSSRRREISHYHTLPLQTAMTVGRQIPVVLFTNGARAFPATTSREDKGEGEGGGGSGRGARISWSNPFIYQAYHFSWLFKLNKNSFKFNILR